MSKPTTIYDLNKLNLSPGTYSIKVRAISSDSNYTESDDSNIVQFTIEAEDTSALIYEFTGDDVIVQLTPANKQFVDLKTDGIYFNNKRVYEIHNYIGLSNNANSDIIGKDVKGETLNIGSTNLQLSSNEGNASYYIIPSYSITYNTNGGTLQSGYNNPTTNVIALPNVLPICSKANYNFEGWYYDTSFTRRANRNDKLTDNVILYANYTPIEYTITYVLNGGTNVPKNPTSYTVEDLPIRLLNPGKGGYRGSWLDNGVKITTIDVGNIGTKTLVAAYEPITFNITYELDGGINNPNNPTTYTVEDTIPLLPATKEGYNFIGWYEDGNKIDVIQKGTYGPLTLTAFYEEKTYSISYSTFGGTLQTGFDNPTKNVTNLPSTLPTCEKNNATFLGWYYDIHYINEAKPNDKLTDNVILYAKYQTSFIPYERHLIPFEVRQWNYYLEKLPLYLQNSYGYNDHFYMLFELLKQLDESSADLLRGFNLFDENTIDEKDTYQNYMNEFSTDPYIFDLLDKIATIYGVSRYFDVTYIEEGETKTYSLNLTNDELLTLVLSKSILSSFDGTYESARQLYNKINLPIYIYTQDTATVYLILDKVASKASDNIIHMFNAGLFNLPSMGIKYTTTIADISKFAEFDTGKYDEGLWS